MKMILPYFVHACRHDGFSLVAQRFKKLKYWQEFRLVCSHWLLKKDSCKYPTAFLLLPADHHSSNLNLWTSEVMDLESYGLGKLGTSEVMKLWALEVLRTSKITDFESGTLLALQHCVDFDVGPTTGSSHSFFFSFPVDSTRSTWYGVPTNCT